MKWWENSDFVTALAFVLIICVIAVCVAAVHIVNRLYPNGLNP